MHWWNVVRWKKPCEYLPFRLNAHEFGKEKEEEERRSATVKLENVINTKSERESNDGQFICELYFVCKQKNIPNVSRTLRSLTNLKKHYCPIEIENKHKITSCSVCKVPRARSSIVKFFLFFSSLNDFVNNMQMFFRW